MSTPSAVLQRPELGATLEEFDLRASHAGFIGLRAAPVLEVARQSANIGRIPLKELLNERDTRRAPGAPYKRRSYQFEAWSYATEEHGAEEPIDDREKKLYRHYIDAERVARDRCIDAVLRQHEIRVAAMLFNASTFSATSLTNEWDDPTNATPIADIDASIERIRVASGQMPNALIITHSVFKNLRQVDEIIDRLKYSGIDDPKNITAQMLAALFGLEEIMVAGAQRNASNAAAAATLTDVWSGEYAMVAKIARTADPREVAVARTMHWGEDGSSIGGAMESYRDDSIRSNVIRARMETDELTAYVAAADLMDNLTT